MNRFPDFVGDLVRLLKTTCPTMGKARIANTLARAGLHLGVTTVGRMLRLSDPGLRTPDVAIRRSKYVAVAKRSPCTWDLDLTQVPTRSSICARLLRTLDAMLAVVFPSVYGRFLRLVQQQIRLRSLSCAPIRFSVWD